jgi:hypothetical protein
VVAGAGGATNLIQEGDVIWPAYGIPPAIPQPSTGATSCSTAGNCLDSLDGKLTQAVAHFDPDVGKETVWTQHTVADANPLAVERWYEIVPGSNASPRQQGDIVDSGLYTFNGAISPTTAGNEAVIFYNTGSGATNGFADFRAQSRNSATTPGTMTNEKIITAGAFNTNDGSCGVNIAQPAAPCRWGDYSAARPDPTNANAVWGTIMLTGTAGGGSSATWSTQVAAYTPGCSSVVVTAPSSAVIGSTNPVSAVAAGCNNPEYAFYVQYPANTGTWTLKQQFGPSGTWNWDSSGYAAGSYLIHVWANQIGDSPANFEAIGAATTTLTVAPSCTAGTLTPPTSAQPAGAAINFIATSNTCPIPEYAYYVQDPTGTWTLKRAFNTDGTYSWPTVGLAPGNYTIHVWVNQRGHSLTSPEAIDAGTAAINICTGVSLPGPGANPLVGTVVPLMATTATGCTNPQYQFFVVYPNGTRHQGQGWGGPSFPWNTGGLAPGPYTVQVCANDIGDPQTNPEAMASTQVMLIGCTSSNASPDLASPQTIGTTITFTAAAPSGCSSPVFEFWLQYPDLSWHLVRPFDPGSFWVWDSHGYPAGKYTIHVWSNQVNADQTTFEAVGGPSYMLTVPTPCATAGLSPPSTSTPAGQTINFMASSTVCTNPQYAYYALFPNGVWNLIRGFGLPAFNWDTTGLAPGTYTVHAWASATGAGHDQIGTSTVTLTGCVNPTVTAPANQAAGTVVNMTGAGDAGCPSPVFEYWVQYPDKTWHLGRTWGVSAWGWDTSNPALKPGTYLIHAWTNQSGASQATYEAIGSATINLTGCTGATDAPADASSTAGNPVMFTVTPTCSGTPVFEYWIQYPDLTWHELSAGFIASNTLTWDTTGRVKGTYVLHVWVNNQGADQSTYETIGATTHILT